MPYFQGFCFCKDAPNVEVDIRQQMIREVMDLCPRGEMNRCLCKDNTKITWPFNLVDLFGCEVKKVQKSTGNISYSDSAGVPKVSL